MYYRKIINELKEWKESPNRKPLVLRGARQVGKTSVVNLFADSFTQFISLNLEKAEDKEIFNKQNSVTKIIDAIFFLKNRSKKVDDTLIFIDEIQEEPYAISVLRYFYEEYPNYYFIAAGSLLETVLNNTVNFPVGRVEYKYMYPFTFSEFLNAFDEQQALVQYSTIPISGFAHNKMIELFSLYILIGGMPEVIKIYAKNKDLTELKSVYESLLLSYIDDVEKYAKNTTMLQIIRHAIKSSFFEAGSTIKFTNFGASNYASREMGEALRTLEKARLLYLVYPTTQTAIPYQTNIKKAPKLQVLDTGLLNYYSGVQKDIFTANNIMDIYKGRIVEHIVGQELIANNKNLLENLLFWVRDKKGTSAEVDFIYKYNGIGIPIEVKAGKIGKLKSLLIFLDMSNVNFAIRLYGGVFSIEKHSTPKGKIFTLLNLPYYLSGNIDRYLNKYFKNE